MQRGETRQYETVNQLVVGSIPTAGANKANRVWAFYPPQFCSGLASVSTARAFFPLLPLAMRTSIRARSRPGGARAWGIFNR